MNNQNFNPDDLLKGIEKSILAKGVAIALVAHAVVVFGTSFGLYRDWAVYGLKAPSAIKAEKKGAAVEEAKARRDAEIQRKAAAAAVAASNAVPVKAAADVRPQAAAPGAAAKNPPEVEPLPPASGEISLDDLGL